MRLIKRLRKSCAAGDHYLPDRYGLRAGLRICLIKKGSEKIYKIKKKKRETTFQFRLCRSKRHQPLRQVSDYAYKTMKRLLPAPTLLFLRPPGLSPKLFFQTANHRIRVPDNRICLALVGELGQPIISTSVKNEDGEIMTDPVVMEKKFRHCVDLVIDGGILAGTVQRHQPRG